MCSATIGARSEKTAADWIPDKSMKVVRDKVSAGAVGVPQEEGGDGGDEDPEGCPKH